MSKACLGVIFGNRDFFPAHLVHGARADIQAVFAEMDLEAVMLDENDTLFGSVVTYDHARQCAELFKKNRERIEGVLVILPNFGDEKGVADTIKLSGLHVPILVQGYPDDMSALTVEMRRDSFCGKISVCNNLQQYDYPFSLTTLHVVKPTSESFKTDLRRFVSVCKVVNGLRNARLGAIGARPDAFNTVRYSEKLLQAYGLTVVTVDLSEILGNASRLADDNARVKDKLSEIGAYARHDSVPNGSMVRMAKLGIVIGDWMKANDLVASALQCWTSIQKNYGVNACTLMSMMSDQLLPSACEVDITGVASMYALQLASASPAALVDWNNNYEEDPDRCVFFHCGNWARSFIPDIEIKNAPILGSTLGVGNTYGAMAGRASAGPMTYARISTDDRHGCIRAYTGLGELTSDPLDTFGHRAVAHVPELQSLLKYICRNGFEHHVAMTMGHVAPALHEAFEIYMGWQSHLQA
jgi:L-fucose isomerase-like protein